MIKNLKIPKAIIFLKLSLFGLLIYKVFTLKLWIVTDRIFPIISFADSFQITNVYVHNFFSIISFAALVILLFKVQRLLLLILVISEFILLSIDVMRWQPTVYQFFLTFIIYLASPKKFKTYLLLLLSATYIYSGLLKFNMSFINFNWSRHILGDFFGLSSQYAELSYVKAVGFIIPVIETLAGILILTKYRRKGFFLIICVHVFILIFLGKLSFTYSFAVWFWNVIMLSLAYIFFTNPKIEKLKFNLLTVSWVVLLFLLPFFNLFEKYYPYFSFDMYSGDRYVLYINTPLEDGTQLETLSNVKNDEYLSERVTVLAYNEMGVPVTHNKWLYSRFIRAFEQKYPELDPCYEIKYYPFNTFEIFE